MGGSGIKCGTEWDIVWEGVGECVYVSGIECGSEWDRVWEGVG